MIDRKELEERISRRARFSFSRSSGKGGQNVNKLNTKVLASISTDDIAPLSEEERARLKEKLSSRLTAGGELFVQVQEERTQGRNIEAAVKRLVDIIQAALRVRRKRKKTRVPAGARKNRLEKKRKHKDKKKSRRAPREGD